MSEGAQNPENQRRFIRFKPDPLEVAYIDLKNDKGQFRPELVALITDESPMGGCGIVACLNDDLKVKTEILIKVGQLAPLKAIVRWRKNLDEATMRLGIQFLE